jgi:zinc-ribbon domain
VGDGRSAVTAAGLLCGSCGTELPPDSRFCNKCGAPVWPAATAAEYKQVTVLFADVFHSMDIAATVGPERLRETMAELAGPFHRGGEALRRNAEPVHGRRHHGGFRTNHAGGPRCSRLPGGL